MPFIVIVHDYKDPEALSRRMAVRDAHLAKVQAGIEAGVQLFGAAMTDEAGNMTGSLMVFDFADRAGLDTWLADEPYVAGRVWDMDSCEIITCKVPPAFARKG